MNYIEKIEVNKVLIGLREDGIIHLYLKDEFVFDNNSQNWLLIAYKYLSRGLNRPMITEGGEFIKLKKEVAEYIKKYELEFPIVCNAVITKNTAHFILAKFFVRINKSSVPVKVFKKKNSALEWAKQFLESPVLL